MKEDVVYELFRDAGGTPRYSRHHNDPGPHSEYAPVKSALDQIKKETIEYYKMMGKKLGVDWKEQYDAYCERMRKKGWRP